MLVNVGLHVGSGCTVIHPRHALAALAAIGGSTVRRWAVVPSATEPTLVADVDGLNASGAYAVAEHLKQDAVATWDGRDGFLIGPSAHAWGSFDPAFFLGLDGRALDGRKVAVQ
jgi:hypothetical protein